MKKTVLMMLFLLIFVLVSCEDNTFDQTPNEEEGSSNQDETSYEKDGDVVKYFETFGTKGSCDDDSDFSNNDCYVLEVEFDDGMTVLMRYYDIPDSVYITLDFVAEKDGVTLSNQLDYGLKIDTSVHYYHGSNTLEGWLTYNGYDEENMFVLNETYEYTVNGDDTISSMQAMLNGLTSHLRGYFEENVGGPFVNPN